MATPEMSWNPYNCSIEVVTPLGGLKTLKFRDSEENEIIEIPLKTDSDIEGIFCDPFRLTNDWTEISATKNVGTMFSPFVDCYIYGIALNTSAGNINVSVWDCSTGSKKESVSIEDYTSGTYYLENTINLDAYGKYIISVTNSSYFTGTPFPGPIWVNPKYVIYPGTRTSANSSTLPSASEDIGISVYPLLIGR